MASESEHFVYVYRDKNGNPVYYGQGKRATRPGRHESGTHNALFDNWLKKQNGQHRVEIIGPLGSKDMANAIESALISACLPASALRKTFFNVHPGSSIYRFRPYGVPKKYVERTTQVLNKRDLSVLCREHGPLMFVRINQADFAGDADHPARRGYDLSSPPRDDEILARIEAWWQVASRVRDWHANPKSSPALLIGVTGGPGSQAIIASARIAKARWLTAETSPGGLLKIPLLSKSSADRSLDVAGLRGRPIAADAGLRFNSFRHSQYRILTQRGFQHESQAA